MAVSFAWLGRTLGPVLAPIFAISLVVGLAPAALAEEPATAPGQGAPVERSSDAHPCDERPPEVGAEKAGSPADDQDMTLEEAADNFVNDAEALGESIATGAEEAYSAAKKTLKEAFE